ncbi:AAA family ATPase [Oceanobacillus oncorhynchi]|uniref:AAA family ATPase n=1 Tax=Oceanobacillus oncorhynchi TaxID=545501 RepID=UPI0034D6DB43
MAVYKPEDIKEGTKFLFYGEEATGKTPTGLSFPNIFLADSDSSSNFYKKENVVLMSDALSYKDLESDFEEVEMDDDLFESIDTIMVDSLTQYHNAMNIAMNKVAEKRAIDNGRDKDAEIMSFREHTKSKTYYLEFFSKLLTYVKMGKNLVCIAEQKDKTETINGQLKKIGVTYDAQKKAGHSFDVIVRTFLEDSEDGKEKIPKGIILKDRTKTFKTGQIIDKPNYSLWQDAVEKKQQGKQRSKDEIKTVREVSDEETKVLDDGESLRSEVLSIVKSLDNDGKVKAKEVLVKEVGTHNVNKVNDVKKLQTALDLVKSL